MPRANITRFDPEAKAKFREDFWLLGQTVWCQQVRFSSQRVVVIDRIHWSNLNTMFPPTVRVHHMCGTWFTSSGETDLTLRVDELLSDTGAFQYCGTWADFSWVQHINGHSVRNRQTGQVYVVHFRTTSSSSDLRMTPLEVSLRNNDNRMLDDRDPQTITVTRWDMMQNYDYAGQVARSYEESLLGEPHGGEGTLEDFLNPSDHIIQDVPVTSPALDLKPSTVPSNIYDEMLDANEI